MDQRKRAVAAGITGNVIFGFSFLASKIALNYAAPMELLSIRFGVSMLILLLLISLKIMRLDLKGKNILPLIALGLCQPVLYFCFENYGLMYSTSSFSGIMIGMAPVASTVTAAIFLKEKVSRRSMAGIAVCVVGVVITSLSEKSEGSVTAVGFLCLCGAIMMAMIYSLLNKRSSGEFSPFERTFVMFTVGFIAFFCGKPVPAAGRSSRAIREPAHRRELYDAGTVSGGDFLLGRVFLHQLFDLLPSGTAGGFLYQSDAHHFRDCRSGNFVRAVFAGASGRDGAGAGRNLSGERVMLVRDAGILCDSRIIIHIY